ncbi:BnaA09g00360D [Brassica napus]|uniref:BnaA09g00360D protein n=1 Tax=Brassica napus TaxID=3708 RepID=A0A078GAH5_BRANA|nr:BnaA09g00360D [Brassica napus]
MTRGSQIQGPTNIDLTNILRQRIEKNKRPSFITDMHDLYEKEPWLLQHVRHVSFDDNLWFYFVTRKQHPAIKKIDSNRPSRKVAKSGRWKTTGLLNYIENKDGVRVGSLKTISYKANSETEKDGVTTGWVMHEFVLDKPGFQELALCRIRFRKRKDNAQYAPRLTPIVIGLGRELDGAKLVENNSQNHMTSVHHGVAAPVETHEAQGMEQWIGSCSGEAISNLALQHQNIMGHDLNYPIFYGGMKKHQDFRSYGQQKNPILGHMKQYDQGSGDRVEYQNQYLGQETMDPNKVPMMENRALNEKQWWNEYSGHLPSQHQHFSLNGSKEQHQIMGSCGGFLGESSGQKQHHIRGSQETYLSLMEVQQQCHNYFWGQETGTSHSAQAMEEKQQWSEYLGQETMDPQQGLNEKQRWNEYWGHLPSQHQFFSMNGSKEQHQSLSSCGKFLGESSGQQQHCIRGRQATSLMEVQTQPCHNYFWGQETGTSHSAQAMEEKQQCNEYSGLYSVQPYVQRMMGHQIFGSSALSMAQNDQYMRQNNDLLAAQQKNLSNLPLTQQQNMIPGQATLNVPCSAQPYDQYKEQTNELPRVPMETQQPQNKELPTVSMKTQQQQQNNELPTVSLKTQPQEDNIVRNSAGQLHLEAQDDVPLIDQTMDEQATDPPTGNELFQDFLGDDTFQEMDPEMANLPDDFCVADLAQEFEKIPIPYSLLS